MKTTALDNWICKIEALPQLTREGLEALQLKRLNETLGRLKARGRFYEDYPDALSSLEQLQSLPFTTAEQLAAHPEWFLVTSQADVNRVISGATSGTTGPAKRVFYSERDTENTVGFFAAGISEMLSAGEKCLIAFPFTGPFGLGDLIAQAVERLGAIPINGDFGKSWGEMLAVIRESRPKAYIGFPVTLLALSRMYGSDFPIERALVSGDTCPEGVMKALSGVLHGALYPHYGSRECGLGGAVTCQAFEGMHIRENHIIPEIIDEQGIVLPEGQHGELVVTTIGAEAMPLIRYRTGDYTRLLPPCPCGGVTKRLDTVSRKEGNVSIKDLDSVLFQIPELVDYCAACHDVLSIDARVTDLSAETKIRNAAQDLYPHIPIQVETKTIDDEALPMYVGKRYVLR